MKRKPLMTAEERARLLNDLKTAFLWMRDSKQPAGAIISHHGLYVPKSRLVGQLSEARVVPGSHTSDGILFVFERRDSYPPDYYDPSELFDAAEIRALRKLVQECAAPATITDEWNGAGSLTVSIQTDALPSPSTRAALRYYNAGCPTTAHGHYAGSVFCAKWHAAGAAKTKYPRGWKDE